MKTPLLNYFYYSSVIDLVVFISIQTKKATRMDVFIPIILNMNLYNNKRSLFYKKYLSKNLYFRKETMFNLL